MTNPNSESAKRFDLVQRLLDVEREQREVASNMDMRPEDTANWEYAETCRLAAEWINTQPQDAKPTAQTADARDAAMAGLLEEAQKYVALEVEAESLNIGSMGHATKLADQIDAALAAWKGKQSPVNHSALHDAIRSGEMTDTLASDGSEC